MASPTSGEKGNTRIATAAAPVCDVDFKVWRDARAWVRDLAEILSGGEVSAGAVAALAERWEVSRRPYGGESTVINRPVI